LVLPWASGRGPGRVPVESRRSPHARGRLHRGHDRPVRAPHVRTALPSPGLVAVAATVGRTEREGKGVAGRIRQEDVASVRERTDIVQVVSGYTQLRKAGRDSLVGICPFPAEKTGSFAVSPTKQVYYCFGCGESGDVFKFVEKTESLSFVEAVERLASAAGVPRRYEAGTAARQR